MMDEASGVIVMDNDPTAKYAGAIVIGCIVGLVLIRVVLERK